MIKGFKKFYLGLSLLLVFLFLGVLFQNCSQAGFIALSQSSVSGDNKNTNDSITDDGIGYAGKGTYYHLVPDFTCENQSVAQSTITITNKLIFYNENKFNLCNASSQNLAANEIDISPFHDNLVGYRDQILEKKNEVITQMPDELVEAWCFDDMSNKKIELYNQYNRITKDATAHINLTTLVEKKILTPFSIARILSAKAVHYTGANYDLVIDKDKPTAIAGQYVGYLKALVENQNVNISLSCRLGGYLDARLWPSKVIVDQNTTKNNLSSTSNSLLSIVETIAGKYTLQKTSLSQFVSQFVSPNRPAEFNTIDFQLSPNANQFIYSNTQVYANPAHVEFNLVDFSGLTSANLYQESFTYNPNYVQYGRIHGISPNGQFMISTMSYNEIQNGITVKKYGLFRTPLPAGQPVRISHSVSYNENLAITDCKISPDSKSVVYMSLASTSKNIYPNVEVYFVNLATSQPPIKISNLTNSDKGYMYIDSKIEFLLNSHLVQYTLMLLHPNETMGSIWGPTVYLANIDGTQIINLQNHASNPITSHQGTFILSEGSTTSSANDIVRELIDTRSLNRVSLDSTFRFVEFSFDDSYLYLTRANQFNRISLSNLSSLTETTVCRFTNESILGHLQNNSDEWLLATFDGTKINIYKYSTAFSSNTACQKLNSAPVRAAIDLTNQSMANLSSMYTFAELKLSADKQKLLVRTDINEDGNYDLLYFPMNGKAPIVINTPVIPGAKVESMDFTIDSLGIIFTGNQLKSNENSVFYWKLPTE